MFRLVGKIIFWSVLCGLAWLGGLLWFSSQIPAAPQTDGKTTDAIVVLTGGSGRLEYALQLLAAGKARTLFVSGAGPAVTIDAVVRKAHPRIQAELAARPDLTVVLGHEAENTIGNAEETARWAAAARVKSIRLVTSNYHMPRSVSELSEIMPGTAIIPDPVFPEDFSLAGWWNQPAGRDLVLSEYHKFLAGKLRHFYIKLRARMEKDPPV